MTTTQSPAMQTIERAIYGYMGTLNSDYPNLVFDERGLARLASIYGWITGLKASEQHNDLGNRAAEEIVATFDRLNKWGAHHEPIFDPPRPGCARGRRIETVKVVIGDDGTFHGFSLLWFSYLKPEVIQENGFKEDGSRIRKLGLWGDLYHFNFNGGLIYHGPGRGETFTVTLGDSKHLWGIHT
jgi:hypothetical protein